LRREAAGQVSPSVFDMEGGTAQEHTVDCCGSEIPRSRSAAASSGSVILRISAMSRGLLHLLFCIQTRVIGALQVFESLERVHAPKNKIGLLIVGEQGFSKNAFPPDMFAFDRAANEVVVYRQETQRSR